MQNLRLRIESFQDIDGFRWPHPTDKQWKVTPETLARAGFYFDPIPVSNKSDDKSPSDRVACFICKAALSNWKPYHDPVERHCELYCDCPMVKIMQSADNLIFTTTAADGNKPSGSGSNGFAPSGGNSTIRGSLLRPELRAARRQSFGKWWPYKQNQQYLAMPPKLAEAGLVYWPDDGVTDRVICFYCDNTFHRWQASDDPMKIHMTNAPDCPFVIEWQGQGSTGKTLPATTTQSSTRHQIIVEDTPKSRSSLVRRSVSPPPSYVASVTPRQPLKKRKLHQQSMKPDDCKVSPEKVVSTDNDFNSSLDAVSSLLNGLPGQTASLFNQQISIIHQLIREFNSDGQKIFPTTNSKNPQDLPSAVSIQLAQVRVELAEKDRRLLELERKLSEQTKHHKDSLAELSQEWERKLSDRQTEVNRLSVALQKTTEESAVWRNSWDSLKKENDKLKNSMMSFSIDTQNSAHFSNGNGSGNSSPIDLAIGMSSGASTSVSRYSGLLKLPPCARRAWYEGEWRLFESRLQDQQMFRGREFLSLIDIPWPVSPATPLHCQLTFPMISSFLLSDLKTDESVDFARRLLDRFAKNRVQQDWLPSTMQRERQRVSIRAEELATCLQKFLASAS